MADSAIHILKSIRVGKGSFGTENETNKAYYNTNQKNYFVRPVCALGVGSSLCATTIDKINVTLYTQKYINGKPITMPVTEHPVFCWKKNGSQWQPTSLLFTDDSGIIRAVVINNSSSRFSSRTVYDLFLKNRIVEGQRIKMTTKTSAGNTSSFTQTFYRYLRPCKFEPGAEYFFTLVPVWEILEHRDDFLKRGVGWEQRVIPAKYVSGVTTVDVLPEKMIGLIQNPPDSKWYDGAFNNVLTEEYSQTGRIDFNGAAGTLCSLPYNGLVLVPLNFTCYMAWLYRNIWEMESDAKALHNFISHKEKVANLFDCLINFLLINRGAIQENNEMEDWQKKIQNYIYLLIDYQNLAEEEYSKVFSDTEKEKAVAQYHNRCDLFADEIENIFLNPDFAKQVQSLGRGSFGSFPVLDWFIESVPSRIICESLAAIGLHASEPKRLVFYRKVLLPFFLKISFTLNTKDLQFLAKRLSPVDLKISMPFLSDEDTSALWSEISNLMEKETLSDIELIEYKLKLRVCGGDDSTAVLNALYESDQLPIAQYLYLVFDTFNEWGEQYDDIDEKLMISSVLLRANYAALKKTNNVMINEVAQSRLNPGERRCVRRYEELVQIFAKTTTVVNDNFDGSYKLRKQIKSLSVTLDFIDSLIVINKFAGKTELTWEDKRDLTIASISLTENAILFINLFSKAFREDIVKGYLAPISFVFAILKGQNSIRKAAADKDYPAVAFHSYSIAISGTKSAEALFKMLHRLRVVHLKNRVGMHAAKMSLRKGFMFSKFLTGASKITGPIGIVVAMYQVIQMCESASNSIRRSRNKVWDQTCKFVEAINSLMTEQTAIKYHDITIPQIQANSLEATMDIHGALDPIDWKTFFERTLKVNDRPTPHLDFENILMHFDRENSRSKLYERVGVPVEKLQVNDSIELYKNGGVPIGRIAEILDLSEKDLNTILTRYEQQKQFELEEHWRELKTDHRQDKHMNAIIKFVEG